MHRGSIKALALLTMLAGSLAPRHAQAGPLLDWLLGRRYSQPAYPVGTPVPVGSGYAAGYAPYPAYGAGTNLANPTSSYYGAYYGSSLPAVGPQGAAYPATIPSGIAATTLPGSVPSGTYSYVPNYSTYANRAPVTYYRPLLTTDPNTGAQVVTMAPCTSYEYQTQRVPTFGRSALYGSYPAPSIPLPPQSTLPTYTLPSGGIPLANNGYSSPLLPTVRGFTPDGVLPSYSGLYPTAPLGNTAYYGAMQGSCGSNGTGYQAAPYSVSPGTVNPGVYPGGVYPNGTLPGLAAPPAAGMPTNPQPNFQSPMSPSTDPAANVQPTLPGYPTTTSTRMERRPQLQRITQQPVVDSRLRQYGDAADEGSKNAVAPQVDREAPTSTLMPIPVPQGFEPTRDWNPGLLKADDMTALRSAPSEQLAGMSTKIHWASFESPQVLTQGNNATAAQDVASNGHADSSNSAIELELAPSNQAQLRKPVANDAAVERREQTFAAPARNATEPATQTRKRYDDTGWQAGRGRRQ